MKKHLTKIFAVMAMSVMTVAAGAINIPQAAVGDYIEIGTVTKAGSETTRTTAAGVTLTKCQVDGSLKEDGSLTSYTVGSTGAQTQIDFALNATVAGYYSFSFMSGSGGYTAKLSLSLKNSSSEEVWSGTADIINNSTWNLTTPHLFALGNLSVDTYTMTIKVTEQTTVSGDHSYAGNYGNFCFHTATQYNYYQSIPQDLGSYIVLGSATGADGFANYITKANCNVDTRLGDAENNKYYAIGTTHANTKLNINVSVAEAGNYVFGFKSGASGCSSVVNVKMTAFGSDTPMFTSSDIAIADDGNWDPNKAHNFYIPNVAAGYYTISLEVKENTGSYAGNFGRFFFHHVNQLGWATSSAYMELSDGTFTNARYNNDNVINYISRTGSSIDDLLVYNNVATSPLFHFNIDAFKQASKVTITVNDFATGTQEAQETIVITGNGDKMQPLKTVISAGLKKVRFDFADNDETADDANLFNFRQVYFTLPASLPIESALSLHEGGVTYNNVKWNAGDTINYIKAAGSSIDNLYIFNGSESFYKFCFNITYIKQNSIVGVTITDMATGNIEINNQTLEITANGDKVIPMVSPLTTGLKKIRIDFSDNDPSNTDEHLFNFQTVTLLSVSSLPLTGTAVLDLNQVGVNFHDCRYENNATTKNIGFIKNGSYADNYYIYNSNPTAYYTLDAGIPWYKKGGTFKITITDVATGNVEVDGQESPAITGTGDIHFDITNVITPGIKKIRFDFVNVGETDNLFNLNNVSFKEMDNYTRVHPHMNLNTLCFPHKIYDYTGATFYSILETEVEAGNLTKLVLEEHQGVLEAGVPYFYDPTEGETELVCYYGCIEQATPQTAANGAFVGSYADNAPVDEGGYVTVNNQLYKCGTGVTLAEYRAYVKPQAFARAAVPGRRRLTIGGNKTPTDIEVVNSEELIVKSQKVLRDGQLFIIRDGKTYNAMGQMVK